MEKWIDFYNPHFTTPDDTKNFVESCENHPDNIVKILMHQAQRLVSLSDDIQKIRPHDETLQLLFLIMCVENISKLQNGYTGEGESKKYVKKFFNDFLSNADKDFLGNGFIHNSDESFAPLTFEEVVEMLYKIRCDVVHEGNYTGFVFHDGTMGMVNIDPDVIAEITLQDIRDVIIRGCITAIRDKF